MNLDQAEQQYRNDPMFHNVVDAIAKWILDMNVTPGEARSAAMLAAVHVEQRRVHQRWGFVPAQNSNVEEP